MDITTARKIEQTANRVDVLMAAVESLTKALTNAEERIEHLEDLTRALNLRRPSAHNGKHRQ